MLETITTCLEVHQLDELNLSNNALGIRGIPACKRALHRQQRLKRLYMNNDGLQGDAVKLIVEYVIEGADSGRNGEQGELSSSASAAASDAALPRGTTYLEEFEIFNNLLRDDGAKGLVALVAASPNLKRFRMATTRVAKPGGFAICQSIANANPSLRSLDLSDNTLGHQAAAHLHRFLSGSSSLVVLNLSDTGLRQNDDNDDALNRLFLSVMSSAAPIESIHFADNELTKKTARPLSKLIESKAATLHTIQLDHNPLFYRGLQPLCQSLAQCKSMRSLSLVNCNLTKKSLPLLLEVVKSLDQLKSLNLAENAMSQDDLNAIQAVLPSDAQFITDDNDESMSESLDEEEEMTNDEFADGDDGEIDALIESFQSSM